MNDGKYTRDPRGTLTEGARSDDKETVHADKLMNEANFKKVMRKKFRTGKADTSETKFEIKKREQLKKQGRKKIYKDAALASKAYRESVNNTQDTQVSEETVDTARQAGKDMTERLNLYGKKLHAKYESKSDTIAKGKKKDEITDPEAVKESVQKKHIKKELVKRTRNEQLKENAVARAKTGIKDAVSKMSETLITYLKENPFALIMGFLIITVVLIISGALSSCSVMASGGGNAVLVTSFTAEDEDILETNADYTDMEAEIQEMIADIEHDHPGYDEYKYNLNEIGHNPFELASLLTVLHEDYTPNEVQGRLNQILEKQYELTLTETIEKRTRTEERWHWVTRIDANGDEYPSYESYEVEVEYDYKILNVTLMNNSVDYVARSIGLSSDQLERYEILLETYGNKRYLFADDPYAIARIGEFANYDIPPEYLTDEQFANMIREAEKYLGKKYVWGGSDPDTGFDCSGFVSYVINHSGNGYNVGRKTANGLMNECSYVPVSSAKPGDLIFFQGTYATGGASHVGIYVGDGMMLHCGNPIQYTSIETNYWQNHFLAFGRLNQ